MEIGIMIFMAVLAYLLIGVILDMYVSLSDTKITEASDVSIIVGWPVISILLIIKGAIVIIHEIDDLKTGGK